MPMTGYEIFILIAAALSGIAIFIMMINGTIQSHKAWLKVQELGFDDGSHGHVAKKPETLSEYLAWFVEASFAAFGTTCVVVFFGLIVGPNMPAILSAMVPW